MSKLIKKQRTGTLLILIGVALFTSGTLYPMITATIDDTSPVVSSTHPADGETYQYLAVINVFCSDPETGVAYVHYKDDSPEVNSIWCSLTYKGEIIGEEAWESSEYEIPPDFPEYDSFTGVYTSGTYNFEFEVSNNNEEASLITTVTGQYTIYTALQGDWYVNDILITSQTQELRFANRTLNFKFVKTAGSTVVTASVSWTGGDTGSMTLTETVTDTWEGSHTFTHGGRYVIELRASDGITDVVMSIFIGDFGEGIVIPAVPLPMTFQILGVSFVIAGVVVSVWKPKRLGI